MDTVGAQSWNGSLMETLIKIVFFHLHCGIAGNPKVQRLKMFCFSASLCGCVVYFCIIDTATDMFIFWLSLLNCHCWVWKILNCLSICRLVFAFIRFLLQFLCFLSCPTWEAGWLKSQEKKSSWDCWYRARYLSGMSSWTQFIPKVWFLRSLRKQTRLGDLSEGR